MSHLQAFADPHLTLDVRRLRPNIGMGAEPVENSVHEAMETNPIVPLKVTRFSFRRVVEGVGGIATGMLTVVHLRLYEPHRTDVDARKLAVSGLVKLSGEPALLLNPLAQIVQNTVTLLFAAF